MRRYVTGVMEDKLLPPKDAIDGLPQPTAAVHEPPTDAARRNDTPALPTAQLPSYPTPMDDPVHTDTDVVQPHAVNSRAGFLRGGFELESE